MGYYLERPDGLPVGKATYFVNNDLATELSLPEMMNFDASKFVPCCLVDNGMFEAFAVCYSPQELKEFAEPDGRPKRWFLVKLEEVKRQFPRYSNNNWGEPQDA